MFMFVIVGVFIAIAVIAVIAESAKVGKKNREKAEAEKAMKLLDDKEDFKKFLDYDSSSTSTFKSVPQRPTSQTTTQSSSKQQMIDELRQRFAELQNEKEQKQANAKNIVTSSHHDSHCDISHKDRNDRYRVEYVPTMNSIGGKSSEGCQDHYNVRYVKLESEQDRIKELTPLQKAIVYGEVINEPAFKRNKFGSNRR